MSEGKCQHCLGFGKITSLTSSEVCSFCSGTGVDFLAGYLPPKKPVMTQKDKTKWLGKAERMVDQVHEILVDNGFDKTISEWANIAWDYHDTDVFREKWEPVFEAHRCSRTGKDFNLKERKCRTPKNKPEIVEWSDELAKQMQDQMQNQKEEAKSIQKISDGKTREERQKMLDELLEEERNK